MKKLLTIFIILFISVTLMSCQKDTTNEDLIEQTKIQLQVIGKRFGQTKYEDLIYEEDSSQVIGSSNVIMFEEGSSINKILIEGDTYIMLSLHLEPSARGLLKVWSFDITYIDRASKVYVAIEYYYYNEGFFGKSNYKAEEFQFNFVDVYTGIYLLTIKDIQDVLYDLGYKEVRLLKQT